MQGKRKEYADGKIVAVDFKKIEPSIFYPVHTLTKEEFIEHPLLCTPDGRWFINTRNSMCDYILPRLELIVQETRYSLEEFRQVYKGEFKDITMENWLEAPLDDVMKDFAFTWLLIPGEIKRRELEKAYYHKQKIVKVR